MFRIFKRKKEIEEKRVQSSFTTHAQFDIGEKRLKPLSIERPQVDNVTFDSFSTSVKSDYYGDAIPESIWNWYVSQGFVGYNFMSQVATHWLVDKACSMPARDVMRRGYDIDCGCTEHIKDLRGLDADYDINRIVKNYIHFGRVFGGQAALFLVEHDDPEYYENPFNIDAVEKGNYKGIQLIDPIDMRPDLTSANVQDPASPEYMKPTYWIIGTRRYHHSHFEFFIPYPVAKKLKPQYNYFGVSVPQRIYERVYASERTANEAPILAMTKRTPVLGVSGLADSDDDVLTANIEGFMKYRDNHGLFVTDSQDTFQQHDTALADLDITIMTQYQLVASASNVPATKLLGTTPKGFNSTGEYEEGSYREELESISTNDALPLLSRHYNMLSRSLGNDEEIQVTFMPMDSPTAKEQAEINALKAQTANAYFIAGAVSGEDIRKSLALDKDSDFYGIETEYEDFEEEEEMGIGEEESDNQGEATNLFGITSNSLF